MPFSISMSLNVGVRKTSLKSAHALASDSGGSVTEKTPKSACVAA